MRHMAFTTKTTTTTTTTTMPLLSSSSAKPKSSNPNPSSSSSSGGHCKHSPSATLDVLILVLVLFSGAFLLTSYFSYIFRSLSLLLATAPSPSPSPQLIGFLAFFLLSAAAALLCCGGAAAAARSRRCHRPGCEGLKKAMEFDLKLQSEDALRSSARDFDRLPWKGGGEGNPDYECLRSELRKMAPPNGRAVLLFRAKCGCPVAKLEGWGPKRAAARRYKKS